MSRSIDVLVGFLDWDERRGLKRWPLMAPRKKDSFEDSLERLEKVVASLEKGDLTLEGSIKAFEEGTALAKTCEDRLSSARKRIELLVGGKREPYEGD